MTTLSEYDNFERFDWKMDQCLEWWDEMATHLIGRGKFANNFDENPLHLDLCSQADAVVISTSSWALRWR